MLIVTEIWDSSCCSLVAKIEEAKEEVDEEVIEMWAKAKDMEGEVSYTVHQFDINSSIDVELLDAYANACLAVDDLVKDLKEIGYEITPLRVVSGEIVLPIDYDIDFCRDEYEDEYDADFSMDDYLNE